MDTSMTIGTFTMKSEHIQSECKNIGKLQNTTHIALLKPFCFMDKFQSFIYNFSCSQ